jgi:hypothetical protein
MNVFPLPDKPWHLQDIAVAHAENDGISPKAKNEDSNCGRKIGDMRRH